jgi:hypothetical protein
MNATAKHTPGPWKLEHSGYANAPFVVYTGEISPNWDRRYPLAGVNWIAEIRDDESPRHEEYAHNARLIAAAPELLETLKAISAGLGSLLALQGDVMKGSQLELLERYEGLADAAIKKTTGAP